MTEPRLCARCGGPLTPAGECPRCLLRLGLELPPRDPTAPPAGESPPTTPPPAPRPPPPSVEDIARRFPQLEIKAFLGQGGMGVVYRARQPRLDRDVALKVLPPELSGDAAFAERFLREARAMARLSHPNIVAVHDFGETDGLCWLLMELVDGVNLRQALKTGALAPEKALAVVPQMCDALQYAHDEGVVHRDIKPENVLLDRAGRVKLVDFGLAKLVGAQDATITRETQVFGTPHYMAPEQMEGARDVDHRADIFSLGVVFYEMLTGRLPVGRFEPPSRRVHVDVRLDEVVLHALEHEPSRRYQHAAEVKTDIESVAAGKEPAVAGAAGEADAAAAAAGGKSGGRFAGVIMDSPWGKFRWPRPKAESASAGAAPEPKRRSWWARAFGTILLPLGACALAWHLAGLLANTGEDGVVGAVLLMLALTGGCVWACANGSPALREARRKRGLLSRTLGVVASGAALTAGLLALGEGIVENWEHGTEHYISDSRTRLIGLGEDAPSDGFTAAAPVVLRGEGDSWEGWVAGVLLLVGGGLFATLGGGREAWPARAAAMFGVPALLLGGLVVTALWSDALHEAEVWPDRVLVGGSEVVALGPATAAETVERALRLDGYVVFDRHTLRIDAQSGAKCLFLALQPLEPWDRWAYEDGQPRRRRPYIEFRFFADGTNDSACRIDWNAGRVRPVASEESSWRQGIERILRDAPRFSEAAAGG